MWDIKACLVCFSTDGKLFSINNNQLRYQYNILTGLQIKKCNGMPEYLCLECASYIKKFVKFRDKCHRAYFTLEELLKRDKEIKEYTLNAIDQHSINIKPSLSYLDVSRAHFEKVKFQWTKSNRNCFLSFNKIPTVHCTTITEENIFEVTIKNDSTVKEEDGNLQQIDFQENFLEEKHDTADCGQTTTTSYNNDIADLSDNNGNNDYFCSDTEMNASFPCKEENNVDREKDIAEGSELDPEYATLYPISKNEAKAVIEVYNMLCKGKYSCEICKKPYNNEALFKVHLRRHDKHVSGQFRCEFCDTYYKTDFLLKTHLTDKHMHKFVCKQCNEVNFDRASAKQHYIVAHMKKRMLMHDEWLKNRPSWMNKKGGGRGRGPKKVVFAKPPRKRPIPDDFPTYSPVTQPEQYQIVLNRKKTRNYRDAKYKCELCYKGYRIAETFNKHMRKHDPEYSGDKMCDMCKLYFKDTRKLYKHMNTTHIFKYSCQMCAFVSYNRAQAQMHYKWHKNVTYTCPHCDRVFKKASTKLTHIRIKHPSTYICNLCGHSFVSETGLYCHKQISHSAEEVEAIAARPIDTTDPHYCAECNIHFQGSDAFVTHLGSSNKHATVNLSVKTGERDRAVRLRAMRRGAAGVVGEGGEVGEMGGELGDGEERRPGSRGRPRRAHGASDIVNNGVATTSTCEICSALLINDIQGRKHYETEHPGEEYVRLKRYMCDICGHITKQYANLMAHMRTHTNEKPFECPLCDRRFSMPSNRDRHLVVHTGEKRFECQHCNRRFTQSSALKLHIQTVHLKIPYAPWDKKNRKRRKLTEGTVAPAAAAPACVPQVAQKILIDSQGDYLNAYITYNV